MTEETDAVDWKEQAVGGRAASGEDRDPGGRFTAEQVAAAFAVAVERVHRALAGEFGLDATGTVGSRRAQHLAEVILGDLPLAEREAALLRLGGFTPRPDDDWGLGDTAPGEESDRLSGSADRPDDASPSPRSSHDPSLPTG